MRDRLTPALLRERAGLTQQQLAIALGKSVSTVSKWEQFTNRPRLTLSEVRQLIKVLGCTLDEAVEAFDRVDRDRN